MAGRFLEHSRREPVPGGLAGSRGVKEAAEPRLPAFALDPAEDGEDGSGEFGGRGRLAVLVGHHAEMLGLAACADHRAHEVPPRGRDDPGGAQHDGVAADGQHRLLAGKLRGAINAERCRRVGFDVGRALDAVEDVIGGDMDERDPRLGSQHGEPGGAVPVGAEGRRRVILGGIDGSVGGGVDHRGEAVRREGRRDRLRPVEVERGTADVKHRQGPPCPRQRGGELPTASGDEDRPRHQARAWLNQAGQSTRRGRTRSFSDSTARSGPIGQGMPRSGSLQSTPHSVEGSYSPVIL